MLDGIKINLDLDKISWWIDIVIIATIFSLFALAYNVNYIKYGFITFTYGVIAQTWELAFNNIFKDKKYWILFLGHFSLIAWWLYIIFCKL